MLRPALAFVAALAIAGCSAEHGRTASPSPTAAGETGPQAAPRGGSSPGAVLVGVAIGVGLILFLLSDEGGGGGAAFLPPA